MKARKIRFVSTWLLAACLSLLTAYPAWATLNELTDVDPSDYVGASLNLSNYTVSTDQFLETGILTLTMTVINESPRMDAYNIKVSYKAQDDSVLPVYGTTSQFYIPQLAAGESVVKEISFQYNNPEDIDRFVTTIHFAYADLSSGTLQRWESSIQIGCYLNQSLDRIELVSIQPTALADSAGNTPVNLVVRNKADFDMANAEMIVDDMTGAPPQEISIGTVPAGTKTEIQSSLILPTGRLQEVQISFAYENEEGEPFQTQVTQHTVYRYSDPSQPLAATPSIRAVLRTRTVEIAIYIGLMILVIGLLIVVKHRKNKVS